MADPTLPDEELDAIRQRQPSMHTGLGSRPRIELTAAERDALVAEVRRLRAGSVSEYQQNAPMPEADVQTLAVAGGITLEKTRFVVRCVEKYMQVGVRKEDAT